MQPEPSHRCTFGPVPLQDLHPYYEHLCPCAPHRYSGTRGVRHLRRSLRIGTTGSHVPHQSLIQLHAAYMPGAEWALDRSRPTLVPEPSHRPGFDTVFVISTRDQRFTCVRLSGPHLTQSLPRLFHRRSPPGLFTPAARGGLKPPPARRLRGALPHLWQSIARRSLLPSRPTHVRDTP